MKFTPQDYRAYVQISRKRHLLVEGRDDKRAFKLLIDEIQVRNGSSATIEIDIDSANDLVAFPAPLGNREKVEEIATSIQGQTYSSRFVGFVDREFREFVLGQPLEDRTSAVTVHGRLVWSRGHSLENYYFDVRILRGPLRDFSVISDFDKALALLSKAFPSVVLMATAASLVGHEMNVLWLIRNSIDWKTLIIHDSEVSLDLLEWEKRLARHKPTGVDMSKLLDRYKHWLLIAKTSESEVVRLLCHGHIGFSYLWASYARCVYEVTADETEASRVLRSDETVRINASASSWARFLSPSALDNYPSEVFRLLSIAML